VSESYQLFHFESCPYCLRVRRFAREAGIDLSLRDILRDPAARAELIAGGGRSTVPCLRIDRGPDAVEWLYESALIIQYLDRHARGEPRKHRA
jgi:glutathione S-transferase